MSEEYRIIEWNKTFRVQKKRTIDDTTGYLWWKKKKDRVIWNDLTEDGKVNVKYVLEDDGNWHRRTIPYKIYPALYDARIAAENFEKGEIIHDV